MDTLRLRYRKVLSEKNLPYHQISTHVTPVLHLQTEPRAMTTSAGPTAPPAPPAFDFSQNERVLCYHGPLIYEAKVLKVQNADETTTISGALGPHYFVHYKGWKQT